MCRGRYEDRTFPAFAHACVLPRPPPTSACARLSLLLQEKPFDGPQGGPGHQFLCTHAELASRQARLLLASSS